MSNTLQFGIRHFLYLSYSFQDSSNSSRFYLQLVLLAVSHSGANLVYFEFINTDEPLVRWNCGKRLFGEICILNKIRLIIFGTNTGLQRLEKARRVSKTSNKYIYQFDSNLHNLFTKSMYICHKFVPKLPVFVLYKLQYITFFFFKT